MNTNYRQKKIYEWLETAQHIASTVDRDRKHISLIVRKNKLVAVGTNSWKTHPDCRSLGYKFDWKHSELDAYIKIKNRGFDKLELLNFRFSRANSVVGMSKPCVHCMPWCEAIFDKIYYTDTQGSIVLHSTLKEIDRDAI